MVTDLFNSLEFPIEFPHYLFGGGWTMDKVRAQQCVNNLQYIIYTIMITIITQSDPVSGWASFVIMILNLMIPWWTGVDVQMQRLSE